MDLTLDEDGENIYAFTQSDLKTIGDAPQVVVPNNQSVPPQNQTMSRPPLVKNYITMSWDRITESDFRYVEVWESTSNTSDPETDAARILEVYDNSFTRNLLAGSKTRYYWLRAVDRYGNKSDFAGPVEATTTGDQDCCPRP